MPTLIAKNALRYASRDLLAGEKFEATDSDAHVLVSVGKAHRATDEDETESGELTLSAPESGSRRRYNRRDMRAKD